MSASGSFLSDLWLLPFCSLWLHLEDSNFSEYVSSAACIEGTDTFLRSSKCGCDPFQPERLFMQFCGLVNLSNWQSTIAKKPQLDWKIGKPRSSQSDLNKTRSDEVVEKDSLMWNECSSKLFKWSREWINYFMMSDLKRLAWLVQWDEADTRWIYLCKYVYWGEKNIKKKNLFRLKENISSRWMIAKRPYANSFWELKVNFWSSNTYMLDPSFENLRGKQINCRNWEFERCHKILVTAVMSTIL